jgi:hypothetical protein
MKEDGTKFKLGNGWAMNNHDYSSPSMNGNKSTREELGIKRGMKGAKGLVVRSREN